MSTKENDIAMEHAREVLCEDIDSLLQDAKEGEFGDFTNKKYPAPKIALVSKLQQLIDNVKNGKYDE